MKQMLLICGTSHTGKSTLAQQLGKMLGWQVFSTDEMARHPGRPWENAPAHVIEYFDRLSDDTLHKLLKNHHENMRPSITQFIRETQTPFILEGAALHPDWYSKAHNIICLYSDPQTLCQRMRQNQHVKDVADAAAKFITRSLRENDILHRAAQQHGILCINTGKSEKLKQFSKNFIQDNLSPDI